MRMTFLLSELNEAQQKAVRAIEGPSLIIAGAGSGKTRTLTYRIAYLIADKNVPPSAILAVTFTNKAAQEMRERTAHLLARTNVSAPPPLIGTFHSVCVRILRAEMQHLGRDASFTIFDAHDQLSVIKRTLKDLGINPEQFAPRAVQEAISRAKNDARSASDFVAHAGSYFEEVVAQVYAAYEQALRENNALDFDDLLMLTVKLFTENPDVLERYQDRFRYILVDEYQDTNHAQYLLITLLARKHRNLFIIGDDYQSIYGWRQADIRNILEFEKDYPDATVITLEQNYRSTQNILDAAYHVIRHNTNQRHKKLWTEKHGGQKLISYAARDERDEAEFIAREIVTASQSGRPFDDFVILYRTNAQSRIVEEIFLSHDIPYRIVGGIAFYERKEIRDIIAYLRLTHNLTDRIALARCINEPRRGIGPKTIALWHAHALRNATDPITTGVRNDWTDSGIPRSKTDLIHRFSATVASWHESKDALPLAALIRRVYKDSGYEKLLADGSMEGEMRHENVQELLSVAKKYDANKDAGGLARFLEEVALTADTDEIDRSQPSVHLMTLHSAKGLEFPIVFIVGLEEGLIPHSRSMLSETDMEEERRLLYVGITRAREKVYFLFTQQRLLFGSTQVNPPSRFLEDIPDGLMEDAVPRAITMPHKKSHFSDGHAPKKTAAPDHAEHIYSFADGERAIHPDFGEGIVVAQDTETFTIAFKKFGIKKLAKGIAPLKKS